MKNRNLLSNILYIVILVVLAAFLVVQFNLLHLGDGTKTAVSSILLAIAVVAVAFVEIVFPVMDNKEMLKDQKYKMMLIVKSVLFIIALALLFLYEPFGVITSMPVALIGFVVIYFIQFFINLDPKPLVEESVEEEADGSDGTDGFVAGDETFGLQEEDDDTSLFSEDAEEETDRRN